MRVFLSYTDTDKDLARDLTKHLVSSGLEISNADTDFLPGDDWHEQSSRALKNSDAMVVLYSRGYSQSRWSQSELSFALGEKAYENRVIPVLVSPVEQEPWVFRHLSTLRFESDPAQLASKIHAALSTVHRDNLVIAG